MTLAARDSDLKFDWRMRQCYMSADDTQSRARSLSASGVIVPDAVCTFRRRPHVIFIFIDILLVDSENMVHTAPPRAIIAFICTRMCLV